jgi:hypothetical protein
MDDFMGHLTQKEFDDLPFEGPRSCRWLVGDIRKRGQAFQTHHEIWVSRSGIRDGNRAVHEHATLCRILHQMCTYDQLSIANLASAEAAAKRLMLIEEAYHKGGGSAPVFDGSEHYLGIAETAGGSAVDPALRKHATARQKEEGEYLKERRKLAEERAFRGGKGNAAGGEGVKGAGGKTGGKVKAASRGRVSRWATPPLPVSLAGAVCVYSARLGPG